MSTDTAGGSGSGAAGAAVPGGSTGTGPGAGSDDAGGAAPGTPGTPGAPGAPAGTVVTSGMGAYKLPRHLSPDQVRGATFERAPFGRRGFDEQEVLSYLERVADELAARDSEIARLEAENRQLKHALREWHRQLVGYDSAEIIARTQQHIEDQIAQAEQYSREREEEAARRYDEIVAEARRRAQEEAERVVQAAREAGALEASATGAQGRGAHANGYGGDAEAEGQRRATEWLRRQQVYVGSLQQALASLAAQVDATRQAFGAEVERLTGLASLPAEALSAAAEPGDDGDGDDDTLVEGIDAPVDEPPLEPLPEADDH
ncbi:MAG TPA: DivIVA domain-containing protein [Acidimicrobiales bacterium]